ncbi:SDR family oxidoreductase [Streptomyces sp. NPDC047002]|uniref:SDR family oxidoreductase n=1 Tax=Streptomyces sp. NPDC047002 TaxID=3155475 RepID=UPI0034539EA4
MSAESIAGATAVVTGAGRGFGRGIAGALVEAGARVIGVGRDGEALKKAQEDLGDGFVPVPGDATEADLAEELIAGHRPAVLVLNAGANPVMGPLSEHTWDSFRGNWDVDVKHVFTWVRAALRLPLAPGSTVVSVSSGAALRGSPLSGGYAGAKATVRFVSAYAAGESESRSLGIRFLSVLPMLSPATDLGASGVAAYAAQQGVTAEQFVANMGAVLTPEKVGAEVLALIGDERPGPAYLLTPGGASEV